MRSMDDPVTNVSIVFALLCRARNELEEDQIYAMIEKWDRKEVPMLCRRAGKMELIGLGLPTNIGEKVDVVVRVSDLSFAEIRAAREKRRGCLDSGAISIGDAANRVVDRIREKRIRLDDDIPCEGPRLWTLLKAAAHEAKRRGARISLIQHGFLVQSHNKAEIVRWEQADIGILDRALMRVAPLESDRDL